MACHHRATAIACLLQALHHGTLALPLMHFPSFIHYLSLLFFVHATFCWLLAKQTRHVCPPHFILWLAPAAKHSGICATLLDAAYSGLYGYEHNAEFRRVHTLVFVDTSGRTALQGRAAC